MKEFLKISAVKLGVEDCYIDYVFNPAKIKYIRTFQYPDAKKQRDFLEEISSLGEPMSLIVLDTDEKFVSNLSVDVLYERVSNLENEYEEYIKEKEGSRKNRVRLLSDGSKREYDGIKKQNEVEEEKKDIVEKSLNIELTGNELIKEEKNDLNKEIKESELKNEEVNKQEINEKELNKEKIKRLEIFKKDNIKNLNENKNNVNIGLELKGIKKYCRKMKLADNIQGIIIEQRNIDFLLSKDNIVLQDMDTEETLLCLEVDEIMNAKYSDIEKEGKDEDQETILYIPVSYNVGEINEVFRVTMRRKERNRFNFIRSCIVTQFSKYGKKVKNYGYSYYGLEEAFKKNEPVIYKIDEKEKEENIED